MITLLNWLITFFKNTNPVVMAAFTAITAALSVWRLFTTMWGAMFAKIDALVVSYSGGAVSFSALGLIDSVFPLTEMLNLIVAYAAIRLGCSLIRIVKSFVPTIA